MEQEVTGSGAPSAAPTIEQGQPEAVVEQDQQATPAQELTEELDVIEEVGQEPPPFDIFEAQYNTLTPEQERNYRLIQQNVLEGGTGYSITSRQKREADLALVFPGLEDRYSHRENHVYRESGWLEGIGNEAENYGVLANIINADNMYGGVDNTTDPDERAKMYMAEPSLLDYVDPEYHDFIMGARNLEQAEFRSDRMRAITKDRERAAKMGFGKAMGVGAAGFILDPANAVPAAVIFKGMTLSARLAVAAGIRAGETTIAKKMAVWSVAGGAEELARNSIRLQADPSYDLDRYLLDAGLGLGMGGAGPLVMPAFRTFGKGARALARGVSDVADSVGVQASVQTLSRTARKLGTNGGVLKGIKEGDARRIFSETRHAVNAERNAQYRELRNMDIESPMSKAVKDIDIEGIRATGVSWYRTLTDAVIERAPEANRAALRVQQAEIEAKLAGVKSEGTTTQQADAPVPDHKQASKEAKKVIQEAKREVDQMIEKSGLEGEALENARIISRNLLEDAENGINWGLARSGITPSRTVLNNARHTEAVMNSFKAARGVANRLSNAVATKWAKARPDGVSPIDLGKRLNHVMKEALGNLGYRAGDGKTIHQALEAKLKGLSRVQRKEEVQRIVSEYAGAVESFRRELADDPRMRELSEAEQARMMEDVDAVTGQVESMMDLMAVIGRNPYEDAIVTKAKWAQLAENARKTIDSEEIAKQFNGDKLQWGVKNQFGRWTHSLSSRLLETGLPLTQWFVMNVLEVPSGFGGGILRNDMTAAVLAENLNQQSTIPVLAAWQRMLSDTAKRENWDVGTRWYNQMGSTKTHARHKKLAREVQLEMLDRHLGRPSEASAEVRAFVDTLDKSYSSLHDLQNGYVAGIHDGNKIQHYMHQVWDEEQLGKMLRDPAGREHLTDLITQAVEQGIKDKTIMRADARIIAQGVVDQKYAMVGRNGGHEAAFGQEQIKGMLPAIDDVMARIKKNGVSDVKLEELREILTGGAEGGVPGYAITRLPLNLRAKINVGGQEIRMVDLMDSDVPAHFARYSREATGRYALSKATDGMIRSDADINDFLNAAGAEAVAMGGYTDTRQMRNALNIMLGREYIGQLPVDVRRARDYISLVGMGGLGESQLAELGMALNRGQAAMIGAAQTMSHRRARSNKLRGMELTPEQQTNHEFLRELQETAGILEEAYLVDRPNLHFDQIESQTRAGSSLLDTVTGGKHRPLLQYLQTRFTGYGIIRAYENNISLASITQDMAKRFTPGRTSFTSDLRWRDLGVDPDDANGWLAKRFRDTVTYNEDGTVKRMNFHLWSQDDRQKFGVITSRYTNQQVQKTFIGELSPEMMNPYIAFLMQFKSYPVAAAEKQQARHLKFADKEAAIGMFLNTVTSSAARIVRAYSLGAAIKDDKEREQFLAERFEPDRFAHDTFLYMGNAAMFPEIAKVGASVLGVDSWTGGTYSSPADMVPAVNMIEKIGHALGGLGDGITDDDVTNLQKIAPIATMGVSNGISRVLKEAAPE